MDLVDRFTDGTYFLVHLFKENEAYLNKALSLSKTDRHTILDNSVFELEHPFDPDEFVGWINKINPTEYIIPDVLEDAEQTIQNVKDWIALYKNRVETSSKMIGVVQGKSYDEIVRCYKAIEPLVDKVAISFDYSCYESILENPPKEKLVIWCEGRKKLLEKLLEDNIINTNKPHHLLGGSLWREWTFYRNYHWIDSIDTSSPVMWALEKRYYTTETYKPKTKLFTLIDFCPSSVDENLDITAKMVSNIQTFRRACNG